MGRRDTPANRIAPRLDYQQDPIRRSIKVLGAKWTLLVLRDVGFLGFHRFGQIVRNNPGLTPRVLSKRLVQMRKEGLLKRVVKEATVSYELTPRGEDAVFILLAFLRYGLRYHMGSTSASESRLPSFDALVSEWRSTGPSSR